MSGKIVIQLDHNTLMQLIGGDTEGEIQIKHGIIENFAHNKLKSLLNSEVIQDKIDRITNKVEDAIAMEVKDEFGEWRNNRGSWTREFTLKPEIKEKIKDEIKSNMNIIINDLYKELSNLCSMQVQHLKEHFEKYIEKTIEKRLTPELDEQIDNRIRKGIMKRIDALKVL